MMGRDSCRWTQVRLPLLSGGDLTGDDRRRAERHVITCGSCRQELEALASSVSLLRMAGDSARQDEAETPSLWPALQRQVRESRRQPAPRWDRRRAWAAARLSLAASVLLSLGGLGIWAVHRHFEVVLTVKPRPGTNLVQPRHRSETRARRLVSHRQEVRPPAERDRLFDDEEPEPREPLARGSWPDSHSRSEPTR